jgi:hypothetical protein
MNEDDEQQHHHFNEMGCEDGDANDKPQCRVHPDFKQ